MSLSDEHHNVLFTHVSVGRSIGTVISYICDFVCDSLCLYVRALKGKRYELSTPNTVQISSTAATDRARKCSQKVKVTRYLKSDGRTLPVRCVLLLLLLAWDRTCFGVYDGW